MAGVKPPNKLLYAQVREDTEVDLEALSIGPEDTLFAVTSGGCTALRLLAEGPKELTCVDFNPAQNYLLELKLAAIRSLPIEECRRFLGARKGKGRLETYRSLAGSLSAPARAFWDARPRLIEAGVLYAGSTEELTLWMRHLVFGLIHKPGILRELLRRRSVEAQAEFYRDVWSNRRWRWALGMAFHPYLLRAVYGKPFTGRLGSDDLARLWTGKIERAFTGISVRSNYFLSQFFWGRFLPGEQGLPPYLQRGIYEKIRANADRIKWTTGDMISALEGSAPGAYTKVTLSNAFEWIPEQRVEAAFSALGHAMAPQGRAVLRHLLGVTPLPAFAPVKELGEISDRLTRRERAFLYTRVSVYERN